MKRAAASAAGVASGAGAVVVALVAAVELAGGAVELEALLLLVALVALDFFGRPDGDYLSWFLALRSSMVETLVIFLRLVMTVLRTGSVSFTIPSFSSRAAISGVSSRIFVISVVIQAISSALSGSNSALISMLFKTVSRAAN